MKKNNLCAGLGLAAVLLVPMVFVVNPAVSQESRGDAASDEPIDQIVVVAHKSERSVRDIAANVTVLTAEEINANLATSVADMFRYSPGVDYEAAGSRFGTEGINIRGIGGNRVAILVDGVPMSDQFDVGSFSNATRDFLNAGLVNRVEVLHGPASALYGSAAIGGVVAVRTPDPRDLMGRSTSGGDLLATWRGADDSAHGTGMFAFGNDAAGLLVGGSIRSGEQLDSAAVDEQLDKRDYDRRSALIKLVADDPFGQTWRFGYIHQAADVTSDLNSLLGTGRYRSTTALEGDDAYRMDLLSAEYLFGSPESFIDSGTLRGYFESAETEQQTLDERALARTPVSIDRYFSFEQEIYGFELNLQKEVDTTRVSHRLGFGIEYRERDTEEYRDGLSTNLDDGTTTNVILGEVFPLRDFPLSESVEWGAYIEDVAEFGNWSVISALRADRYELTPSVDPMYAEDYPFAEPVSLEESDVSPKFGLIYRINDDTDVYIQYAHGFRAPPYEDANIGLEVPFFNYRAIPNPDLKSESSDGIDAGIRWQGANAGARLSVFQTRYEDFIESKVNIGTDPVSGRTLFQSQNLARTEIRGIEAGAHVELTGVLENFRVDAALYYADGENKENGQPLNSVGPAQAVVGARWTAADGGRQVRLQATLTDAWDDRDESRGELFKPPGHAVFDLFFMQQLGDRTTLRAGLLNLTDKTYWSWSDVRGFSPQDPMLPYLARAGRSFTASLNVNW